MTPAALDWLARFRRYMISERRMSAHTDASYARDLAALVKFCDRHGLKQWSALDSQHVRTFAAHSHAAGLSPRSIQRRLSAVRSFYAFLLRESPREAALTRRAGRVTGNPGHEVRAPKAARRLPQTLDADQMARLLEIPAGDHLTTRDRAIMELLYSSGLRLAELVGLEMGSLDLKDRLVHVMGKGKKGRIVPVGRAAVRALKGWLKERATLARADESALFVGRNGARLGGRAVQARVAYWARRQGLNRCPCTRTCSGIRSPRTCWSRVASCAGCRSCSDMRTSRPPRSIPTLTSSTWPASTTLPTRAHAARPRAARPWRAMTEHARFDPHGTTILGYAP
jgi:integrase/recombinase XerC